MIFKFYKNILYTVIFICFFLTTSQSESTINRIEIIVNDNVITNYDIIQRVKITAILRRINIDNDNYNLLTNSVIDELVEEHLKKDKVKEYDIEFTRDEFKNHEKRFIENFNYEKEELNEIFSINNISYRDFNDLLEIDLKWQKLIIGLYLRVTSATESEVETILNSNSNLTKEQAKDIILQKQIDIKSDKLLKDMKSESTIEYKN